MIKHYWNNDSHWERPPCDCCEGFLMECYNLVDDLGVDIGPHSLYSVEECYLESYMRVKYGPYHQRGEEAQEFEDKFLDWGEGSFEELKMLCKVIGLEIFVEELQYE